jgi:1-acyl-sn-glycerol-3-phosphate acyltransferase
MSYEASLAAAPIAPVTVSQRALTWVRWLRLALEFIRAAWILRWRFPGLDRDSKLGEIRNWSRRVLAILEVEVECDGAPPPGFTGLVVSNHVSWLDILVIQSVLPGAFVAKAEVRRWPVIGSLAQSCATIFVERASSRSARAMVDASVAAFDQGYCVIGFPEGTSSDGTDLGVFHANIFESAIRCGSALQPLTLRYVNALTGLATDAPVFIGETSLAASVLKVMSTPAIKARLHFGNCISPSHHTRKSLALQAHQSIRDQLLRHAPTGRHATVTQTSHTTATQAPHG